MRRPLTLNQKLTRAAQFSNISISAKFSTTGIAGTPIGWMFREDLYSPVRSPC